MHGFLRGFLKPTAHHTFTSRANSIGNSLAWNPVINGTRSFARGAHKPDVIR